MQANLGYRGIMAPTHLNMRYLTEDVPCSLVPIASIGEMFNVPMPAIKSLIFLASALNKCDYYQMGRTVERLGIANMTLKELRLLAIGE